MLLLDHESLPRIKPHLHLYTYNIHNIQIPVKNILNIFHPAGGVNPRLEQVLVYQGKFRLSCRNSTANIGDIGLIFLHLSLLPRLHA